MDKITTIIINIYFYFKIFKMFNLITINYYITTVKKNYFRFFYLKKYYFNFKSYNFKYHLFLFEHIQNLA